MIGGGFLVQVVHLPLVSVLLGSANKLFPANGAQRSLPFVDALDVDEQIGSLTVGSLAHRTLVPHFFVDALHVGRQHFSRIIDFVTIDAFQFSFDVLDESVVS